MLIATVAWPQMTVAADRSVHLANRPDFIDDETIQKFEAESGITVTVDTDNEDQAILAGLKAHNPRDWDLVVLPSRLLGTAIASALLQPIDKQKLSNLGNIDPEILIETAAQDPGNRFNIPYLWGTVGLAANAAKLAKLLPALKMGSLATVFDPVTATKLASCGVAVEDSPQDVIPAVLLSLGLNPWSENPRDLKLVQDRLLQLKGIVRRLSPDDFSEELADGKICAGFGTSVDIAVGQSHAEDRDNGVDVSYAIPKERAVRWIDVMALPVASKHATEALALIDYLLRPEVIANVSDWTGAANPNRLAADFMAADKDDQTVFPGEEAREALIPEARLSPENVAARARIWQKTRN